MILINEKNNLNTVNDRIRPQFRIAPLSIKPPGVKAILRNKPPFRKSPQGGLIRFFAMITVLRFLRLKSKYDIIICILLDILCYYATKTKKTNQITECGTKASKDHHRMDTKCMEQYLVRSHREVIKILCVDNCTRWG